MDSPETLLAIVGMPGSGKSIASAFFQSKKATILRFGDQTDIGLTEAGLPINEENERMYREKIRKELGMAAMAIKIEPRIYEAAKSNIFIVLDGLYSWEEYIYLKQKFPQLILLCMYAAPEVRYARLMTRSIRPLTIEEAKARDRAEIEHLNKGGPIAMADHIIVNNGDESALVVNLTNYYSTLI